MELCNFISDGRARGRSRGGIRLLLWESGLLVPCALYIHHTLKSKDTIAFIYGDKWIMKGLKKWSNL